MAIFINIKYEDETGAITQCDAQTCAQAIDALKVFFQKNKDKTRSAAGARIKKISAINTTELNDCYAIEF